VPEGKICICDDEKEILRYLKKILLSLGYTVDIYSEGKALLDRLESDGAYLPDLLIQDIRMPDISGVEVLQQVRRLRRW